MTIQLEPFSRRQPNQRCRHPIWRNRLTRELHDRTSLLQCARRTYVVVGLRRHISRYPKPRVVLKLRGTIRLGNEKDCKIVGTGEVPIQLPNGNTITLQQVRHVPALKRSLVSIGMLSKEGYRMTLNESTWMISRGNLRIGSGHKYNNLYPLLAINPEGDVNVAEKTYRKLWHGRLAPHVAIQT